MKGNLNNRPVGQCSECGGAVANEARGLPVIKTIPMEKGIDQ